MAMTTSLDVLDISHRRINDHLDVNGHSARNPIRRYMCIINLPQHFYH